MAFNGKGPVITGPKANLAPLLVRMGTPDVEEYVCPAYPKWVGGPNGKAVIVKSEAEDAENTAAVAAAEKVSGTLKLKG